MESRTLVTLRYVGQPMRGFDRELFKDVHDDPLLPDPQELVRLQAQLPLRVRKAVRQRITGVRLPLRAVHGLQEKMAEPQ